jgi:hypothetical protein
MRETEQATFAKVNYFPERVSLEFKDFISFFKQRKEVLRNELKLNLALASGQPSSVPVEWSDRDEENEPREGGIAAESTE